MRFLSAAAFAAAALSANGATIVFNPTADSYVRNAGIASATTTNFGTDAIFVANNANGIRLSFLRFDLSGITEPVSNLKLDLTINLASVQEYNVYGLTTGENWTETGITWNNAPAVIASYVTTTGSLANYLKTADLFGSGTILATFTSGPAAGGADTAFNVSSGSVFNFMNADADKVLTFVIAETDPTDAGGVGWNSRDAATGKPTLTVTTVPEPSSLACVALGAFLLGGGRFRRR